MDDRAAKKNRILLIGILLLDLMGFSLIFPLVPDLLDRFLRDASNHTLDSWVPVVKGYVSVLLPDNRRSDNDLKILLGGILSAVYSFLQFLLSPYWGRLSDRIGRRSVLILTSSGLALSYLVWFFSSSFTLFIAARILGGMMAGNLGVASAAMADMSTPENRTKMMGMIGAAFGMGFIMGPALGGITSHLHIQDYFSSLTFLNYYSGCALAAFFLSLFSAVINYKFFTETIRERKASQAAWISNPFKVASEIRFPGFITVTLIYLFYLLFFSGFEFTLTFFYQKDFGLSPGAIAGVFVYLGLVIAVGQGGIVRALTGRIKEKAMTLIGLGLLPLPLIGLAYSAPGVVLSLVYLLPICLGASLIQPALTGLASLLSHEEHQGVSMGVFRSAGALARAVGPALGAYLYWFFEIKITYWILAVMIVLTILLSLRLKDARA